MDGSWNLKPHGSFPKKPENGAYISREPKGIPDVLLFAQETGEEKILGTAAILSVQGITARIVLVADMDLFLKQDADYIRSVFSEDVPVRIGLMDGGMEYPFQTVILPADTEKQALAQEVIRQLRT